MWRTRFIFCAAFVSCIVSQISARGAGHAGHAAGGHARGGDNFFTRLAKKVFFDPGSSTIDAHAHAAGATAYAMGSVSSKKGNLVADGPGSSYDNWQKGNPIKENFGNWHPWSPGNVQTANKFQQVDADNQAPQPGQPGEPAFWEGGQQPMSGNHQMVIGGWGRTGNEAVINNGQGYSMQQANQFGGYGQPPMDPSMNGKFEQVPQGVAG